MLKIYDTTRLFYNKYAFKLTLSFSIGMIFRDKNWKWARTVLDCHMNNDPVPSTLGFFKYTNFSNMDYVTARQMFNILQSWNEDFLIRVEHPKWHLYTNEKMYKDTIIKRFPELVKEICEPSTDELYDKLVNQKNIIISDDSRFKYQIELEYGIAITETLQSLKNKNQIYYRNKKNARVIKVANQKVLTLVQLLLHNHIKKIYTIERG
jgi:hypothetical protein